MTATRFRHMKFLRAMPLSVSQIEIRGTGVRA
eukprot:COSAG04_NODE_32361_length_251_cov_1.026316_1_plen_31_part_10